MPKLPILRAKDFLKYLIAFGCEEVSVRGSHHKVYNPESGMTTVVSVHSGIDLKKSMLAGILNQLGIDVEEFLDFIA